MEEDKVESGRTRGGLHPEGTSNIVSGGIKIPSFEDKSEGEANVSSPMVRKGLPPKIGRKRLLSEARCPRRAARAWRMASSHSPVMRASLQPYRE